MIYKSLIHLLSSNILLLFFLSLVFFVISTRWFLKFEQNNVSLKLKKFLPSEVKNHKQEILVCYIPVFLSAFFILLFGTYFDFIMLFLGSSNFFALILLSDKKIKAQLTNKEMLLDMMKWELFVFLTLFILIEFFYGAKEFSLYIFQLSRNFSPMINELNSIIYVVFDLTENLFLIILFSALISASFIVANCVLLYITLLILKKSPEEN
ncbi:hypothetical protein [uncultured Streptococcus sp.]|uniref:hypothetical protein n=1 Tax=uncultured Streptococcus sp. TaxID=83427 RepID=UPI0032119616